MKDAQGSTGGKRTQTVVPAPGSLWSERAAWWQAAALSPIVNRLGWRTEFPWSRYQNWVAAAGNVAILERRPLPPLGHFSLIRLQKSERA